MSYAMSRKLSGTGWIPDFPDGRDYTSSNAKIVALLSKVGFTETKKMPTSVNLRMLFPPVFQQGPTNSCTAQAAASIVSYFDHAAFGKFSIPSRMFIYKATRNILFQTQDAGAFIRSTIEALTIFGSPPELYWPFVYSNVDVEPPAFCYAFGERFRTLSYYRYEEDGQSTDETLNKIKLNLFHGIPSIFGLYLFESIGNSKESGKIPYPSSEERPIGGHAVVAVGFDDDVIVSHPVTTKATKGAILIRNSWGEDWGEQGYGWLPYDYVLGQLATDWWSILSADWLDTSPFAVDLGPKKAKPSRGDS